MLQKPKGTRDFLPETCKDIRELENLFVELCSYYGYKEIRYPMFERTALFERGVGASSDIVRKEMFRVISGANLEKYCQGTYDMQNEASFDFGGAGGVTLESLGREPLRVSYIAVGTPERDKDGKIVNAVIVSSYYSGDSAFMYFFWYDGQGGNAFSEGPIIGP